MNNTIDYNLFLIGFMGAGKSTVSRAFKKYYGMEIMEMDEMIAKRCGMSIPDIFKTKGETFFREQETALLRECAEHNNIVVSCGGGVPMRQVNVDEMRKSGKIVWLSADPETILKRVKNSHDRPLLENNKNVEFIADLMNQRRPKYEAAADLMIQSDGKPVKEICREILDRINDGL